MTEAERKKPSKILGITIPTGAVAAAAIGCGVAALVGKFGKNGEASWYFTHPFGKDLHSKKPTKADDLPSRTSSPLCVYGAPPHGIF